MQTLSLQYCSEQPLSIAANMLFMSQVEDDHLLIKALVDAEENGFASRVARKIGVSPSTINRHYNGTAQTRLGRDTLAKLQEHYPGFHGWLTLGKKVRAEVSGFGDRPFEEKFGTSPLPAIPLVGSAIGMSSFDPERDIELTELDMAEVLGHVQRPESLANDRGAYALTVVGDSMSPKYDPGARIIVSPRAPIAINDYVVVQLRANGELQVAPTNGDPVSMVLIKRLVRRSSSYIELLQFNPEVTFRVDADRVAAMHKVIGEVY